MIDRIRERAGRLKFGRAALTLLALPFVSAGWLVGKVVWLVRLTAGAIATGYDIGSGR